jgi:2,3-bisphosphoglycerate-independent phosphoglycerate mutase
MLDESGGAQTAHSLNPVPLAYIGPQKGTLEEGILADVSPTLLRLMGLPIPPEMSGRPLFAPEKKTCITQPGVI